MGKGPASVAVKRVPRPGRAVVAPPSHELTLVQDRMGVRSLDGVKHTSRSLGGMNHLGSGHVLMNNRQASREDQTLTDCANPYDTQTRNTAHSPPTGSRQPASKDFFEEKPGAGTF